MKSLLGKVTGTGAIVTSLLLVNSAWAADKVVFADQAQATAIVSSVGLAKGYFKKQGIDLDIKWTTRGKLAIEAVGSGKADFGVASPAPVLGATANGLPIVMVGALSNGFAGYFVSANKYANLHSLEAFKGKVIGVQVGSGVHTVLMMAIEKLGLAAKDFEIQNIRVTAMPLAMQAHKFDAVFGWDPYMSPIVKMGNGTIALPPKYFEQTLKITYPLVILTSDAVLKSKSQVVQRFMNALAESQRYVTAHPNESLKLLRAKLSDKLGKFDETLLRNMTFTFKYDRIAFTPADMADVEALRDFLVSHGRIKKKVPMSTLVNNKFAKEAETEAK
jgi:ABC-type nitrate/sulfonate/bicarbonate transport system substrate-binding protein